MLSKEAPGFYNRPNLDANSSIWLLLVPNDAHDTELIHQVHIILTDGAEVTPGGNLTVRCAGQKKSDYVIGS